jgi:hypothetical protein
MFFNPSRHWYALLIIGPGTMTIKATKFTPEVLLSAPRRSPGRPNSDASKILYKVSTYSFSEHENSVEIRLLDSSDKRASLISNAKGVSDVQWVNDETVMLIVADKEKGTADVVIGEAEDFEKT